MEKIKQNKFRDFVFCQIADKIHYSNFRFVIINHVMLCNYKSLEINISYYYLLVKDFLINMFDGCNGLLVTKLINSKILRNI